MQKGALISSTRRSPPVLKTKASLEYVNQCNPVICVKKSAIKTEAAVLRAAPRQLPLPRFDQLHLLVADHCTWLLG